MLLFSIFFSSVFQVLAAMMFRNRMICPKLNIITCHLVVPWLKVGIPLS